ncbi:MAG: hypothetical protein LBT55_03030 [Clostridiaceae bacterium]|nr:hypothetical protein [Clostridiaceae bacterium]
MRAFAATNAGAFAATNAGAVVASNAEILDCHLERSAACRAQSKGPLMGAYPNTPRP